MPARPRSSSARSAVPPQPQPDPEPKSLSSLLALEVGGVLAQRASPLAHFRTIRTVSAPAPNFVGHVLSQTVRCDTLGKHGAVRAQVPADDSDPRPRGTGRATVFRRLTIESRNPKTELAQLHI